jgi:hypothetical protein
MRRIVALPLIGVGAIACVHTQATVLNPAARLEPICPEAVLLFTSADRVGKPYTEVAVLTSKGDESFTSEEGMHNSQRKKAAQLGANGVILGDIKDPSTGAKIASAVFGTSANRKGQAVAIHIAEDSTRVRETCTAAARQKE